jgi:hypothetical protein
VDGPHVYYSQRGALRASGMARQVAREGVSLAKPCILNAISALVLRFVKCGISRSQ